MTSHLSTLPDNLPVPHDDGAAAHVTGMSLPAVVLPATDGRAIHLSQLDGVSVLYFYPRTGRPDQELPQGWDMIPGARGCTPQSCAFRDHYAELTALGARHVFGVSSQSTAYQSEAAQRLHLPFALLSDEKRLCAEVLGLPLMHVEDMVLYRRLTLIARDGVIKRVFYPVFPPDKNAADICAALGEGI